jgi:nicotinamidase-related amidase
MNQRHERPSYSPLIDPAVCSLVLIAPTQQDLASVSRHVRSSVRRNLASVIIAAQIIDVPLFLSSPGPEPGKHGLAKQLPRASSHREFVTGEHAFPWQSAAFTEALAREDRPVLVLAGFWLEHQILATALHALADSYDVYIVHDAAPARARPAARLSQDRLIQAGATPVVTSQVIHEWSLESGDASRRAALSALLAHPSSADADG